MSLLQFLNNGYFAGKVGIGTDSPDTKLSISDILGISGTGNNTYGQVDLVNTQTGASGDEIGPFITFRGKRGGVDSVVAAYGAIGGVNTGTTGSSTGAITFLTKNTAGAAEDLVEQMRISTGGNVGIGTTSPGVKLTVVTPNVVNTAVNVLKLGDDTNGLVFKSYFDASGIAWRLNKGLAGINMVTLSQGGNVGIGTTSPSAKLHITKDNTTGNALLITNSGSSRSLEINHNADGTGVSDEIVRIMNNGTRLFTIESGGNVGIGTDSPGVKLSLRRESNGNIFSINRPASNTSALYAGVSGNDTSFYSNNGVYKLGINNPVGTGGEIPFITMSPTNRYTTFTAGNVGIGTTGPSEKLEVAGNIKIQAALLSNQENTDVDTGTETVANVAIATYTAAFFDFVVKKTTNVRSGTVYACHDGTNVEFTETSTNDLGDTSDVTLSVDISGTNMRLLATVTSNDWSVKSLIRAI